MNATKYLSLYVLPVTTTAKAEKIKKLLSPVSRPTHEKGADPKNLGFFTFFSFKDRFKQFFHGNERIKKFFE